MHKSSIKRCRKCNAPLYKTDKEYYRYRLAEYKPDDNMCWLCNATESVILRLKSGGTISTEELKNLPSILCFDPTSDNEQEALYGIQYKMLIKSVKTCSCNQ